MGSKDKGGVFVWCLLLAGLLLAVVAAGAYDGAVAAAEVDAGRGRKEDLQWCKKECEWKAGQDQRELRECKKECERRHEQQESGDNYGGYGDNYGGHENSCHRQCQHHQDYGKKQQCMQDCRQQHGDDNYNGHGDHCRMQCQRYGHGYEKLWCLEDCRRQHAEGGGTDEESYAGHGDSCRKQCQHHRRGYEKQQCLQHCESRRHEGGGGGAGGRGREGDERHGWETVAGAILQAV